VDVQKELLIKYIKKILAVIKELLNKIVIRVANHVEKI
jgi:hypothetical protein